MLGSKINDIVVQIDLISIDHDAKEINVVDEDANVK